LLCRPEMEVQNANIVALNLSSNCLGAKDMAVMVRVRESVCVRERERERESGRERMRDEKGVHSYNSCIVPENCVVFF
jgi:hypothetical protein